MSTRTYYLLAGGNDRDHDNFANRFVSFVSQHVEEKVRFLSCFFGRDESAWDRSSNDWSHWLGTQFSSDLAYSVATRDSFREQVADADVIYLHGGMTKLLLEGLAPFGDLAAMFEGKIVIGSSAGANVIASTYYSPKSDTSGKGRGLVNVSAIVHYGANDGGDVSLTHEQWQRVIDITEGTAGHSEELVLLPEGSFSIFVK
jgi:peptidase E